MLASFVVPVIDLQGGQVVRARRGERARYRPIVSRLAAGSEPLAIARALLERSGATRLYLADLDALQGGAPQADAIAALAAALPGIDWWVDAGFADASAARALLERLAAHAPRIVPVFASEALASREAFEHCFDGRASLVQALLSLDARGGQRLDRAGCWDAPERWPDEVILMTLERVGANAGPDLDTLRAMRRRARPGTRFIGAGGIRDAADLRAAQQAGASAWLVASALHDGGLFD